MLANSDIVEPDSISCGSTRRASFISDVKVAVERCTRLGGACRVLKRIVEAVVIMSVSASNQDYGA